MTLSRQATPIKTRDVVDGGVMRYLADALNRHAGRPGLLVGTQCGRNLSEKANRRILQADWGGVVLNGNIAAIFRVHGWSTTRKGIKIAADSFPFPEGVDRSRWG